MRWPIAEMISLARAADRRLAEDTALRLARDLSDRVERDRETARQLAAYLEAIQEPSGQTRR